MAASAVGGHTVGLPMSDWKHLTPHESNAELRWSADYAERLRHLLTADVGGGAARRDRHPERGGDRLGRRTDRARRRALVLVGQDWSDVHRAVGAGLVVDPDDLALAVCVATVDDVVPAIKKALSAEKENRGPRG